MTTDYLYSKGYQFDVNVKAVCVQDRLIFLVSEYSIWYKSPWEIAADKGNKHCNCSCNQAWVNDTVILAADVNIYNRSKPSLTHVLSYLLPSVQPGHQYASG